MATDERVNVVGRRVVEPDGSLGNVVVAKAEDTHVLASDYEAAQAKLATAVEALGELAQGGCWVVSGTVALACFESYPDDKSNWCIPCIASQALAEIEGGEV